MSQKHVLEDVRTPEPTIAEEVAYLGEDDLFEMANLVARQTGIEGIIFISTSVGQHGPRVKYFQKAGKTQPSFSVSIAQEPEVVANSLPVRVVKLMAPQVIEWVRINEKALLSFWNDGTDWTDDEVTAFKAALKKMVAEA